jgi:hypothetical protein
MINNSNSNLSPHLQVLQAAMLLAQEELRQGLRELSQQRRTTELFHGTSCNDLHPPVERLASPFSDSSTFMYDTLHEALQIGDASRESDTLEPGEVDDCDNTETERHALKD